jgi:hypothetical protein
MRRSKACDDLNISATCDGREPSAKPDKKSSPRRPVALNVCCLLTLPAFCFAPPIRLALSTAAAPREVFVFKFGATVPARGLMSGSSLAAAGPRESTFTDPCPSKATWADSARSRPHRCDLIGLLTRRAKVLGLT